MYPTTIQPELGAMELWRCEAAWLVARIFSGKEIACKFRNRKRPQCAAPG